MKRKILILDMDGTITVPLSDNQFPQHPKDIKLVDGIAKAIQAKFNEDYIPIVVTNQGGVAYGYKTIDDLNIQFDYMLDLFLTELGYDPNESWGHIIEDIVYCAAMVGGKVEELNYRSLLRKPDIGMLVEAELTLVDRGIIPDWDNSIFVGNSDDDMECAMNAKIPFIHVDEFTNEFRNV